MFQTEPILFLQAFAGIALTLIMKGVTETGYTWFISIMILSVMLGLDFRRGFQLFQIVIWTAVLTFIAKDLFSLPRPVWVDAHIHNYETGQANLSPFNSMGASGFFDLLPGIVIDTNRQNGGSFGFPSGHVSSAIALWGGLAVLFGSQRIWRLLPILVVIMGISRMYLGQHFLADTLGGAALGTIVLLVARQLLLHSEKRDQLLLSPAHDLVPKPTGAVPHLLFLGLPLLLAVTSLAPGNLAGSLIGVGGAYLVIGKWGYPIDAGSLYNRTTRVLFGGAILFSISFLIDRGINLAGLSAGSAWVLFMKAAATAFLGIGGSVMLSVKTGLYKKENKLRRTRDGSQVLQERK